MAAPRPDADPAAYTCEWCEEETADGFSLEGDLWTPTCSDCRHYGGTVHKGHTPAPAA
jgi:hypothetical protein